MKTFDPTEALALLDTLLNTIGQYEDLTGRHAKSDADLLWRLNDHEENGTLLNGVGMENAMLAFYEADERPYIYGDDRFAEAAYYGFSDEVHDAVERLGLLQDEDDDTEEGK